ncbi:MAG: hypothetical protein Q6362_000065 [Candidatus Wukongarchaeota archaeon]|nr:hypothetical protein [Candidatus Wukongarchaeota archaeon]
MGNKREKKKDEELVEEEGEEEEEEEREEEVEGELEEEEPLVWEETVWKTTPVKIGEEIEEKEEGEEEVEVGIPTEEEITIKVESPTPIEEEELEALIEEEELEEEEVGGELEEKIEKILEKQVEQVSEEVEEEELLEEREIEDKLSKIGISYEKDVMETVKPKPEDIFEEILNDQKSIYEKVIETIKVPLPLFLPIFILIVYGLFSSTINFYGNSKDWDLLLEDWVTPFLISAAITSMWGFIIIGSRTARNFYYEINDQVNAPKKAFQKLFLKEVKKFLKDWKIPILGLFIALGAVLLVRSGSSWYSSKVATNTHYVVLGLSFWFLSIGLGILLRMVSFTRSMGGVNFHVNFFHPDENAGLLPLGNLSLKIASMIAIIFSLLTAGLVGILDKSGNDANKLILWSFPLACVILSVFLFISPLFSSHDLIVKEKKAEMLNWKGSYGKLAKEFFLYLTEHKTIDLQTGIGIQVLSNIYREIKKVPNWPFNTKIIMKLTLIALLPLLTFLFTKEIII